MDTRLQFTDAERRKAQALYHVKPPEHYGKVCGAQKRKQPGVYCTSTRTIGSTGRCRFHGGLSRKGFEHPNFKDGRMSKYTKDLIVEKIRQFEGKDVRDLRKEIAIIRGLLHSYMDSKEDLLNHKQLFMITQLIKTVEKLVASLKEIEEGQTITIRNLNYIILQVARSIKKHVRDPGQRKQIASDLRSLSFVSNN